MKITLAHGSGGIATGELIENIFEKAFSNPVLNEMEDSAVVSGAGRIAITTDSFVVEPLFFNGGDIGRLSVCGTVNDLLMRGAVPKYLTCGFIIEEGADTDTLFRIVQSMAATAKEAGVSIVAGDTKVIQGDGGIYINTSGVGIVDENTDISSRNLKPGDTVIVSGNLGDHHAAILSSRMKIENTIKSDNAPLNMMAAALMKNGVHAMRDVTRGGLATVLNELSESSGCRIVIDENSIPVDTQVEAFTKILGLNPLYMGNEGKLIAVVPEDKADIALDAIRKSRYGENAAIIGKVSEGEGVVLRTKLGGMRIVGKLAGEGLPRIC